MVKIDLHVYSSATQEVGGFLAEKMHVSMQYAENSMIPFLKRV